MRELSCPISRHRMSRRIKKQNCLQTRCTIKGTNRLKLKGQRKMFHGGGKQETAGVAVLQSDRRAGDVKGVADSDQHWIKTEQRICLEGAARIHPTQTKD